MWKNLTKLILLLSISLTGISCNEENCKIEIDPSLVGSRKLTFVVQKSLENCKYQVRANFWVDSIHIVSKAIMHKKNQALFFKLLEPESRYFRLFDFNLDKDKKQTIKIPFAEGSLGRIDIVLKETYNFGSNESIYQFIILDGFDYLGKKLDQVIFISSKRGFIGNYFRNSERGDKHIISPAGNILEGIIDYSDCEFWVLK